MPLPTLAYWGLAYSVGLVCLSVTGLLYLKARRRQDLWLFLFMASMTFASVALSLRELLPPSPAIGSWSGFFGLAGAALCAATFPRFAAAQEELRFRERLSRALTWIGLCLALLDLVMPLGAPRWMATLAGALSIAALVAAVYFSLAWIYRSGKREGHAGKRMVRGRLAPPVFAVIMALVVCLDFLGGSSLMVPALAGRFMLFPALYTLLSGFLIAGKIGALGADGAGGQVEGEAGSEDKDKVLKRLGISGREAEVLALLAKGHTYREIADGLCISPATVKSHVAHLFNKTGARNKVELINLTK